MDGKRRRQGLIGQAALTNETHVDGHECVTVLDPAAVATADPN